MNPAMIDNQGHTQNQSTVNGHVHLFDAIMDAGKFHNRGSGFHKIKNTDNTWRTKNLTKLQINARKFYKKSRQKLCPTFYSSPPSKKTIRVPLKPLGRPKTIPGQQQLGAPFPATNPVDLRIMALPTNSELSSNLKFPPFKPKGQESIKCGKGYLPTRSPQKIKMAAQGHFWTNFFLKIPRWNV